MKVSGVPSKLASSCISSLLLLVPSSVLYEEALRFPPVAKGFIGRRLYKPPNPSQLVTARHQGGKTSSMDEKWLSIQHQTVGSKKSGEAAGVNLESGVTAGAPQGNAWGTLKGGGCTVNHRASERVSKLHREFKCSVPRGHRACFQPAKK